MARIKDIAQKVRSKNAGPFWLTVDIFCGTKDAFDQIRTRLSTDQAAATLGATIGDMKRFDIADLNVIKLSLPRPTIQGDLDDRDMHGASFANLIGEIDLDRNDPARDPAR